MQFKLGFQYMLSLCPWHCAHIQYVLLIMSVSTVSNFELHDSQFFTFCLLVVVLVSRPDVCVVRSAFLNHNTPVDQHPAVWVLGETLILYDMVWTCYTYFHPQPFPHKGRKGAKHQFWITIRLYWQGHICSFPPLWGKVGMGGTAKLIAELQL